MKKYTFALFVGLLSVAIWLNANLYQRSQSEMESTAEKARETLLLHLSGEWVSRALYVVTKLEIADYLKDGPKSILDIASFSQSNPESLQRILHMLAGFGIFEEHENNVFGNNQTSALLSKSHPETLHSLSLFYGEDIFRSPKEILEKREFIY